MPKYSVITTVYNGEKYLRQCLESVVNQTFSDWELVIVNDGSTDLSGSIADEYKRLYPDKVILIKHDNHGTVYSREIGIHAASGKYLLFMDADDWYESNLLGTVDNVINETKADIVQFGYNFKDEAGNTCFDLGCTRKGGTGTGGIILDDNSDTFCYKALEACYCLWARAFKKELFDTDIGFYKEYYDVNMTNDLLAFSKPLSNAKTFCFTDYYLYNYRIVKSSTSHDVTLRKVKSYFKSITWAEKCMRTANGFSDNHKNFFSKRLSVIIFDEYRHQIYHSSIKEIKEVYELAFKIPCLKELLNDTILKESNWYRKAFLKAFSKRNILLPKLLLFYEKFRNNR